MRLFILLLLTTTMVSAQGLLEDFEDNRFVNYSFVSGVLNDAITNPDMSGVNTSSKCAEYIRNPSEQYDLLQVRPYDTFDNVADYVSGNKVITIDVWSSTPNTVVQIDFQNSSLVEPTNYPIGRHSRYVGVTTTTNTWETVNLIYQEQPDVTVQDTDIDEFVLLFNPDSYDNISLYFDNINGPEYYCLTETLYPMIEFDDFECQRSIDYVYMDGSLEVIQNPDVNTTNNSINVGKYTRSDWSIDDVIVFDFKQTLNLQDTESIYVKVWSSVAKEIRLSLQDVDGSSGGNVFDVSRNHSGSGNWEVLEFNYAGLIPSNVDITKGVLLFAPDETGTAYEFYYDELRKDIANQVSLVETKDEIKIEHNTIYFSDHQLKNIELYDISGKKIDDTQIGSSYKIKNKGLVLIHVSYSSGKSELIKYLNL